MPILRYLDEAGAVKMREFADEPIVIGRAPTCQVILDSDMISREHARIERTNDGRYSIRDLGSRNKTHVDGQLITDTILRGGDVIRLGDRVVEFLEDAGPREKIELDFFTPDNKEPADCEWIKIKAPLTLTVQQVEELAKLPGMVRLTTRPEDIADAALSQIMLDVGAERGFIALRGDGKRDLLPMSQRGLEEPAGSFTPVSQSFAYSSILQAVAGRYPRSAGSIDAKAGYAACGLVAPITHKGEIVGLIYVDRPTTKKPFLTTNVHQLAAAGALVGAMMAEATRKLTESAQREAAGWLTAARRVQQTLGCPADSNDVFSVKSKRRPGRLRCGDLFEVVHLDEQRSAIVMVDGGGRGMTGLAQAAAIRAAGVRAALAVTQDALMDPQAMFAALNEIAASSPARQAVPATYLGIDLAAGKIAYINAGGMPPLVMVAPGRLVTMDQPSLVLGVDRSYIYETTFVDLPERLRVVLFSDGLAEAPNVGGEALTNAKIHEALLDHDAFASAEAVIERIDKLMAAHLPGGEPEDDATLVVVGRG